MLKTQVIPAPAQPPHLQPGGIVADRYRLERELGRGSMGTVWSAIHVTLGQRVAIKLISSDQLDSPEMRQRFSTEAKAAARLRSRHAVQVYDDGETPEGTPYIVMEYLEGETLEERLERTGGVPLTEAVRIVAHVGRALARAHAQGIIHRDLKPANIFIAKSEEDDEGWLAKVLDFGVAKLVASTDPSHTKTGTLVGTPRFMSPEQVRGASHVDQRADLYSLGMVFFNMVTGQFAFDAPSYSDVLVKICMEPLPDLKALAPSMPESVRAWFAKACAREPDERFPSADEMVEALYQATSSERRAEQPSFPDEGLGPSGTVMGYSAPDLDDGSAPVASGGLGPSGTLKSGPRISDLGVVPAPPLYSERSSSGASVASDSTPIAGSPKRPLWPLWLAAGAGLGLALAGGGTLLYFVHSSAEGTLPRPSPAVASAAEPAVTLAPPPPEVAPAPVISAQVAPPEASSAPPPRPSAPAGAKRTKAPRASSTAKRPASTTQGLPSPRTKSGAPDIGF